MPSKPTPITMDAVYAAPGYLFRRMQQIARTVDSIPQDHTFWVKSADQELRVDVSGWRFFYRIDTSHHTIDVVRGIPLVIA